MRPTRKGNQNQTMPKITLGLRRNIIIKEIPEGGAELHVGSMVRPLQEASSSAVKALVRLSAGGATMEELEEIAHQGGWLRSNFPHYYEKLSKLGYITWSIEAEGKRVARLEVMVPGVELSLPEIPPDQRFVLSRFAFSRCLNNKTVIETPLKPVRLELEHWLGSALWGLLSRPVNSHQLSGAIPDANPTTVKMLLQLFHAAAVVQELNATEGDVPEECDQALRQWEFHDLLFHSRTRTGRHDYPLGATFRFQPEIQPLPACKPAMSGEVIDLYKPDLEGLKKEDSPFTLVLEERRSMRGYSPEPITIYQLGEFLYRTARVQKTTLADPKRGNMYDVSIRPYPSSGACHALETYLVVGECDGLDTGLYHYNPFGHYLVKLSGENRHIELILENAEDSTGRQCYPQVFISIAARFQRLSWKYSSISYSLLLKDVGVLLQTMYLVSTAMNLAPCALGTGHSEWLCRAAGLNYLEESPVGEFMLGSKI
ncbi:MAG: SagB/ThcOx family dehydrogenase [Firmicutes bacterium]|nr:SagB/ThcOx family dehydrogenase [Bacillota bacterium]